MRARLANLRLRTLPRWAAPSVVLALPVVVLLLAAGYRSPPPEPQAPSPTQPALAGAPRGGGAASEVATAPTVTPLRPVDTPVEPGAEPAATRIPASVPAVDPLPAVTETPMPAPTHTPALLLPTPDGTARTARVPILMYHHVEVPPPGAGDLRKSLSVPPSLFEQQLLFLQREGYQTISLRDLVLHLTQGVPLPEKPVILTFDDGYRDNYTHAFPLLRRFGFVATFFLVTAPIDAQNPDFLGWDQVREMSRAGMHFEPHSLDHPDMRDRSVEFLVYQVLASKGAIEERTGETCRFFAYPSGRYDQSVIDVLRSAHFWGALVTEQGAAHSTARMFELKRVRVQGADGLDAFAAKLGLDW